MTSPVFEAMFYGDMADKSKASSYTQTQTRHNSIRWEARTLNYIDGQNL